MNPPMIRTLLIANRGEIACRIMRTCRRMGVRAAAVYSDADADSRHVAEADIAAHIGGASPVESYLAIPRILEAARRTGADAVHPGFGFLAENGEFARAVIAAGLIWVGPPPEAIDAMGSKRAARLAVTTVGVPVVPGYDGDAHSDADLIREAARVGYPLMVKAAAGGGGKGMRLVYGADDLPAALASARREALQAFGSDELLLERALHRPRHIEFQVFGDHHGGLIHLGERECSIQRRHQKIIEESPSPAMTPDLRARMGAAAVAAARSVGYANAGTVEFLLDADGAFYFLEMNTRLQVEHPVTEAVTGVDLVEWQIRVAEGELLPLAQDNVRFNGYAVEARVYAENPANDFLPVTGDVLLWREPSGEGVRVDSGLNPRDRVTLHYDPMIAKVIAHGATRADAHRRLLGALERTVLLGLTNNLAFLRDVIRHPVYAQGDLHTGFLTAHLADWTPPDGDAVPALIAASVAQFGGAPQVGTNPGYWRNNPNQPVRYRYLLRDDSLDVLLTPRGADRFTAQIDGTADEHAVTLHARTPEALTLTVDGLRQTLVYARSGDAWWVQVGAAVVTFETRPLLPVPAASADTGGSLRAPMPGAVIAVLVEVGQAVKKGDPLLKLEAMKMEHTVYTAADGVVEAIYYSVGDTVAADAQLIRIG